MGVAVAHRRRTIPRQRLGEADRRPRLYLVPPLPEGEHAEAVRIEGAPAEGAHVDDAHAWDACADGRDAIGHDAGGRDAGGRDGTGPRAVACRSRVLRRPSRHSGRRPIRLTRRGRFVLSALLLGAMAGLALLTAPASQASAPSGSVRTVVVRPGDTLWSISVSALPSEDPYRVVDQVRRLNHLTDDTLFVGEQLKLPPAG